MINGEVILTWNEIEHDLYTENGVTFGVELDLFNGHKTYYYKTMEDGKECFIYLYEDFYDSIDEFNSIVKTTLQKNEMTDGYV